jgi:Flp pilus assembly protein TadG
MTNKLKNERGQTLVEFALVLPILVVLVLAIAQFGVAFNNYVTLTDAARAAARKGAVSRESGQAGACQAAGYAAGGDLTASYPYSISLLGWVVASGQLNTTMRERVE